MMSRQRRACAAGSPLPTVLPSSSGAVPETAMIEPTRTAREMPTFGSYGLPLEMSFRMSIPWLLENRLREHRVDTLRLVHGLSYVQVRSKRAQRVRFVPVQSFLR